MALNKIYKTKFRIDPVFFEKKISGSQQPEKIDGLILPLKLDNRQKISPIDDQGNSSACVCYSVCSIAEAYFWRRNGFPANFDAMELYKHCKKVDGNPKADGTYPEVGFKCAVEDGLFGNIEEPQVIRIDNRKNSAYIDQLKFAIFKYDFVVGGFKITSGLYKLVDGNYIYERTNKIEGGHAMVICGYNKTGFIIANSWGKEFGQKGFAIYPYDEFNKDFIYGAYLKNTLNDLD